VSGEDRGRWYYDGRGADSIPRVHLCCPFSHARLHPQGNLSNPTLFVPEDSPLTYPPIHIIAHHYLDIVDRLKTRTTGSAIKAHLFRILKPGLEKHVDLRNKLGEMWMREGTGMGGYRGLIDELKERMAVSILCAIMYRVAKLLI
jgi:hypothetical protein